MARGLEVDALRAAAVGVPERGASSAGSQRRGGAPRSGARLRHGHAPDDGIVPANAGCITLVGARGDRLRMRLGHLGHCRAEARCGACDRGRSGSAGAASPRAKMPFATACPQNSRPRQVPAALRPAHCVVANILAGPLIELAPILTAACENGADLLLSGLLKTQAYAVKAAYTSAFDIVQVVGRDDWCCIHARRAC